jgi:spore maturation protein SpmB
VQFICQLIWHVGAIINKNIVQEFGIQYYKCNTVAEIMYSIKLFLFKISVLIGDVTLCIAKHAKHVLEIIYSVCVCFVNSVTVIFMGHGNLLSFHVYLD